jgi:hypothetical protein
MKLQDGTMKSDKLYLLTRTCIKPTKKSVSSVFGTPLVLRQATGNSGRIRFTMARTQGKLTPSPYSILCAFLRHLHSNGFLSRDSQGGVSKLSRFGLPRLYNIITFCSYLRLGWCGAPKFLVDSLEGLGIWQCGRSWNLEHDPDFQH